MARQKEFDRDVALDRAMAAFWSNGYAATSIEDLVAGMGIQRGSLYATFGDKRALFLAALERYERAVVQELLDALEAPGSGTEAIRRFFRLRVEGSLDRGRPLGCLLTNSAVELSRRDRGAAAKVGASLAKLEGAFLRALVRARKAGELEARRDLRALARFLTSSAQGLSVMAKTCPERPVLEDVVKVVLAVLERGRPAAGQRGKSIMRKREEVDRRTERRTRDVNQRPASIEKGVARWPHVFSRSPRSARPTLPSRSS